MLRLLTLLLLLTAPAATQTMQDILPRGMTLDSVARLQWHETTPEQCTKCAGTGRMPCTRCKGRSEPCAYCTDRQVPCTSCAGTGVHLDPFAAMICPQCSGWRREDCRACDGKGQVLSVDATPKTCEGCRGARTFVCPLCNGVGSLPALRLDGRDLRLAGRSALLTCRDELARIEKQLDRRTSRDLGANLRSHQWLLAGLARSLPLPDHQMARLVAVVDAARSAENAEFETGWALSDHQSDLSRYVEQQRELVDLCLWRFAYNLGELRERGPMRASTVHWQKFFGEVREEPNKLYTMLGRGFMRAPTGNNLEAVMQAWLEQHPQAVVHVVSRLRGFQRNIKDSEMLFVEVVDGDANLNLQLVEQGCALAATMQAPGLVEQPLDDYLRFLQAAQAAETRAKVQKLGYWGSQSLAREDHEAKGEKLLEQRRYAEALVELQAAIGGGDGTSALWLQVARCHEALGQEQEALAACDRAIGDGKGWGGYREKARCLRRFSGLEAAVTWLQGLAAAEPTRYRFQYLLADFLRSCGEMARAIPHYQRAVELASQQHDFVFDAEGWLRLDDKTLAKDNNDFAELWPTLEELADSQYRTGDLDGAMRSATMGVAIGQQLNRCKGYYSAVEVEAGSVECRVLRARVFVRRSKFVEADKELRLAKVLADRSGYTGYQKAMEQARAELRRARGR